MGQPPPHQALRWGQSNSGQISEFVPQAQEQGEVLGDSEWKDDEKSGLLPELERVLPAPESPSIKKSFPEPLENL